MNVRIETAGHTKCLSHTLVVFPLVFILNTFFSVLSIPGSAFPLIKKSEKEIKSSNEFYSNCSYLNLIILAGGKNSCSSVYFD